MEAQNGNSKNLLKIEADFINPFIASLHETLKVMGRIESKVGGASLVRVKALTGDVMLMFKIDGDLKGAIVLEMGEEIAKKIVSYILLGVPISEIDDMSKNSLKEFALRIAVKTAKQLAKNGYTAHVVRDVSFAKPVNFTVLKDFIKLSYDTEHGSMQIFFNVTKN